MIQDFLKYSVKNRCKITIVFLRGEKMERKTMIVRSVDEKKGTFFAISSGRKKELEFSLEDVLTCDYARGDHGELE